MTTLVFLLLMASAGDSVQYVPAKDVAVAMQKNPPVPMINTEHYGIMAFHRTSAGQAEVHDKDTDVFYVIDGKGTFVTGGKVVAGKTTALGETRGTSIEGGQIHQLSKGDVITIPAGMPHWFQKIDGSFTYFIVKVR